MGTYTTHTLSTIPEHESGARPAVKEFVGYDPFDGECKWYGHVTDMVEVSNKHPEIIFIVHGETDEGDEWILYAHGGNIDKHKREAWDPPKVSAMMLADLKAAQLGATRDRASATERREREMLATLQAKYGDDS